MSTTKNLGGTRKHLPYVDSFSGHRSFVEVIRRGRDKKQSVLGDDKSSPAYNDFNQNLTFDVVEGNMEWSSRSAVAYARSPETIPNLHEYFSMEGVSCCLPGPMGGNAVLLTFDSCSLLHGMIDQRCEWLS
jgi:hypothetical protein